MSKTIHPRLDDVLDAIEARRGPEIRQATAAYTRLIASVLMLRDAPFDSLPPEIQEIFGRAIQVALAEVGVALKVDTADVDACLLAGEGDGRDLISSIRSKQ